MPIIKEHARGTTPQTDRSYRASSASTVPKRNIIKPLIGLIVFLVGSVLLFLGLKQLGSPSSEINSRAIVADDTPLIVASVPHIAIWTKQVAGSDFEVRSLVGGGVDVHDFSFKPADLALVARADLVIANGAHLEPWLDNLQRKFPQKTFVKTAEGLSLRQDDPHTWLDPVLAAEQVTALEQALAVHWPGQEATFAKNAETYLGQLANLNQEIKNSLALLAPRQKSFIAFHDAFNYFAERYGLRQVTKLVERPGDQLTLAEIQNVGQKAEELGLKVLFVEPGPVPDLANNLAHEFNLQLVILDPLEVAAPESGNYLKGMRENLAALLQGLRSTP